MKNLIKNLANRVCSMFNRGSEAPKVVGFNATGQEGRAPEFVVERSFLGKVVDCGRDMGGKVVAFVRKPVTMSVTVVTVTGSQIVQAAPTPVDAASDITAAAATATTVFNGFATLSIAAFVLAMVFAFARKGKR